MWIREKRMYFSAEEMAERLGITLPTFDDWVYRQNKVKGKLLGKTLIFSEVQLADLESQGFSDLEVDTSGIFTNKEAAQFLVGLGLKISYAALVFARHTDALPYERVGGTEERAARIIYHKQDLVVFAAERGAPDFIPSVRSYFNSVEAEAYTAELGERIPRPTLRHNALVQGKIHPLEIEGVDVYSAEQLAEFVSSPADDRRSEIKINRHSLMTVAEATEYLGLDQQEVKYRMFCHQTLPYQPVGISGKGVKLFLLRRKDVEALREELEK